MTLWYELLKDGTIGRSTNSEKVAQKDGLTLTTQENIVYGYDGKRYLESECPEPPAPTHDEISKLRENYRKEHIDSKTAERSRKMANQTWTSDDERAYLDLDAEVTAYINEHFPYPDGG